MSKYLFGAHDHKRQLVTLIVIAESKGKASKLACDFFKVNNLSKAFTRVISPQSVVQRPHKHRKHFLRLISTKQRTNQAINLRS